MAVGWSFVFARGAFLLFVQLQWALRCASHGVAGVAMVCFWPVVCCRCSGSLQWFSEERLAALWNCNMTDMLGGVSLCRRGLPGKEFVPTHLPPVEHALGADPRAPTDPWALTPAPLHPW